ncbi:MAG: RraA family protein [Chloroflexi bacterium]|nr:RraA family protein [Chloroflexota bacterium]MCI0855400.1 RraA family protein [Chloroflexota bacterium]
MADSLTGEELDALRGITSPTISNAIETFDVRSRSEGFMDASIRCMFPDLGGMVGYAVTAKIAARKKPQTSLSYFDMFDAMAAVPKPWLVVIEDLDWPNPIGSYWGEVNGSIYKGMGCVGLVTNGGVRDLDEVVETGFHFFASCVLVSHAYVHLEEVGTPVSVGGLTVSPGDLLHGDKHGVVSIPHEIAREVAAASAEVERRERPIIDFARSSAMSADGLRELFGRQRDTH